VHALCNSMGRGRPFGPPRVRASRKRFRIDVERVVPRTVREAVARLKNRPELLKSASSPRVFVVHPAWLTCTSSTSLAKPLASKASHLWILEYPASRCCAVYSIMEAVARLKNRPELLKSASSPRVFVVHPAWLTCCRVRHFEHIFGETPRFKGQPLVDLGVPCLEVLCRIFCARSVADGAGGGRSTQEPTRTAQVCLFPESICCTCGSWSTLPRGAVPYIP
jgi:hypothetical protein